MNKKLLFLIAALAVFATGFGAVWTWKHRAVAGCEHRIAREHCPFCTPSLLESKGFCAEHGVPEAICTQCDPSLIPAFQAVNDWCAEHKLPESQCEQCNPGVLAKYGGGAAPVPKAGGVTVESGSTDPTPRSQRAPSLTCDKEKSVIRLRSASTAEEIGLEYAAVKKDILQQVLTVNAEVGYPASRYARLAPRAGGVVTEVRVDLGRRVKKGEVLAVIDAPELGAARAEYLQALETARLWEKNSALEKKLAERGVATERESLEAETKLAEARIDLMRAEQKLRSLGLEISGDEKVASYSLLEVTAPFDAVVVELSAVIGQVVTTETQLLAIGDPSVLWAILDIEQADLPKVRTGQPVRLQVEGLRGESFAGTLTWVSAQVDHQTRTVKARAEIPNESGLLRANSFGRADIVTRDHEPALIIPKSAVQWEGCCNVVFVPESALVLRPRKVRLGHDTGGYFEVLEGLKENETVVTSGSYLLKTELMKGSIGAGCCEVDHVGKKE